MPDKARPTNADKAAKRMSHARRADQFGLLLLGCSVVVIAIVLAAVYFNQQRYFYQTSQTNETSTAAVDFYRGDRAFSEKVAEERAAQQQKIGHEVHGLSSVNDDLEVSLAEQMSSMSETMKKMRQEQQTEEPPAPTKDTGYRTDIIPPKPTTSQNFQVPKPLQNP
jgi:uncharacterized protein HemX